MVGKQPSQTAWADRLRVEGVNFKGYGVVPKYAMRDQELSITAKGIYAYFCAMSGSGNSTFPSVETILAHLGFRSETYYLHRQQLLEQGYIEVSSLARKNGTFSNNLFTLIDNPKKFSDITPKNDWQNEVFSTIEHEGLKAAGYGTIPKAVMQDPRLDVKAKAVYAYFASYAGAGRAAFPPTPQIIADLGVSKPTYQKALRALQAVGYIRVEQANWSGGSKGFGTKRYILNSKPELSETKKSETVESEAAISKTLCSETVKSETVESKAIISEAKKPETIKNALSSKNTFSSKNIHPSINKDAGQGPIDGWDSEEEDFEAIIKTNVQYDRIPELVPYPDVDKARELVLLMITVCESGGESVRIGRENIPIDKVRKRLLSINIEHINYVLGTVAQYAGQIRNIRAYNLAALYHAPETLTSYIDSEKEAPGDRGGSL